MKIYSFGPEVGRSLTDFGSRKAQITPVVKTETATSLVCIRLDAGGVVGYHPAATNQLLLVVAGEGWVWGATAERTAIIAGEAAFWTTSEFHETGTDQGMMAVVIEGDDVDPTRLLQERT